MTWPRGLGNNLPHTPGERQRGGKDANRALLTHEYASKSTGLNASHLDMDVCVCAHLHTVVWIGKMTD